MPSYREICYLFNFKSKASGQYLVKKLIEAGLLEKDQSGKLLPKKILLPQLGFIPAGSPISVSEQLLDAFSLEEYLVDQPETSYILEVHGDSMIGAGIYPKDLVIVDSARRPRNGDIVVANVDNEYTLKYLKNKKGKVMLVPANPKYKPIKPKNSLAINGVVISVARKYTN